ncbi:hypothetical protein AB832_05305 [Flavobacteriaceae bacterium (ex Bugula neritina AB1)]|nr:hypothetical protein AB832_05305 [Flavobacteriaceae bacterium (ex Bugula neritina AB1)]
MNEKLDEIKQALILFKETINELNRCLMEKFNIDVHPYLHLKNMPRSGIIEDDKYSFEYRFHGGGCEFIYNKMILDYQIVPFSDKNDIRIKISLWGFRQFLKSLGKDVDFFDTKRLFMAFENLRKQALLSNTKEDSTGLYYFSKSNN